MIIMNIHRGRALRIAVGLMMVGLLTAGGAGAATPISSCTTISSPGEYVLNQNIGNFAVGTCIAINSNDVVFDGAGYTIDGNDVSGTYGVFVYKSTTVLTNVTVKNLEVTNWFYGIYYHNAGNGKIENNIGSSNRYGIYLSSSSNNTLTNNNASNNRNEGISLLSSNNNTLINNNVSSNYYGIWLKSSSNNTLTNNNVSSIYLTSSYYFGFSSNNILTNNNVSSGIYLQYSSNNTMSGNNASNNRNGEGISLLSSNNNTLTNNNVSSNYRGIRLVSSGNNTLTNNNMAANTFNFDFDGTQDSHFDNNIDTSNLVDSKPIFYVKNASNNIYNNSTNAGTFYCIGCNNVTIKDLTLTKNGHGIYFRRTSNSKVENINANSNIIGVDLDSSSNNILISNNANSNYFVGIHLISSFNNTLTNVNVSSNYAGGIALDSSGNNTLTNNNVSSNYDVGIYLDSSSNNTLTNNNVSSNYDIGIYLKSSSDNKIYHNNFINNINKSYDDTINTWDSGYPSGGNYWSDYTGVDLKSGFSQNITGTDGIGDSPYNISGGAGAQDRYPFMQMNGWLQSSVIPFPGTDKSPTDPDGDGLHEDINGNGRKDFNDVVMFFNYLEWVASNQPISNFDFNGNGRIDFNDIIKLFEEL